MTGNSRHLCSVLVDRGLGVSAAARFLDEAWAAYRPAVETLPLALTGVLHIHADAARRYADDLDDAASAVAQLAPPLSEAA